MKINTAVFKRGFSPEIFTLWSFFEDNCLVFKRFLAVLRLRFLEKHAIVRKNTLLLGKPAGSHEKK